MPATSDHPNALGSLRCTLAGGDVSAVFWRQVEDVEHWEQANFVADGGASNGGNNPGGGGGGSGAVTALHAWLSHRARSYLTSAAQAVTGS
jgi:hypothetical protein